MNVLTMFLYLFHGTTVVYYNILIHRADLCKATSVAAEANITSASSRLWLHGLHVSRTH